MVGVNFMSVPEPVFPTRPEKRPSSPSGVCVVQSLFAMLIVGLSVPAFIYYPSGIRGPHYPTLPWIVMAIIGSVVSVRAFFRCPPRPIILKVGTAIFAGLCLWTGIIYSILYLKFAYL